MVIGVIGFLSLNSCRHEFSGDRCSQNPILLSLSKTDATPSQNNGAIMASAAGGEGFSYSLNGSPFQDSGYFNGLQPFLTYNVVVKNSWGCTDTAQAAINITDPCSGVTVAVTATKTDATPGQNNGTITATATGGTGFTYSINGGPFQPAGSFTGLAIGSYTVTAKNADGCTGFAQVTIVTNDPCAGVTVVVTTTKINPTIGQSNGSITATATGGSGFTYSINNGAFQASGTFTGLPAGNYTITAKSSIGCIGITTVTLTATDPCAGITVVVTTTQVNPTTGQSNGSITASATGGTGFTYSLNGGAFQASGLFSGLAAGNYTVTAKNSNGCLGTVTVALGSTNPCQGITVVVTTTQVNPTIGQSNGSITATASGGTGFTYSLNGGAFQASGTFTGLAAGTYTVTAKSSVGCLGSATVTLIAVDPCNGVTIIVTTTQVNPTTGQSNGSITATASGGTGFTYSLNGGAFQASGTFTGLAAGTYTVTARSSLGCLGSKSVTLVAVSPCTAINIIITTVVVNNTPCTTPAVGSITVTATGSTGFTYNINGGAYQASNVFSALAAGNYTVGVKDINGCTKTATATVGNAASGPLFAQMRTLISTRCNGSGCHIGTGNNAAGYNFDSDCNIVSKWTQINHTCVLYTSGWVRMPKSPQPFFTAAEKQKVTDWINAGHRFTD
ncbi:MAG: SprB repeat-containing protein [Chitinophagaceae bacterium]|nr:SprB repeat-containing protein [Chitinophagaceae bacterium]